MPSGLTSTNSFHGNGPEPADAFLSGVAVGTRILWPVGDEYALRISQVLSPYF